MIEVKDPARPYGSGLTGWLAHLGTTLGGLLPAYREQLRESRRRTIVLTVIVVLALIYPLLNRVFLADFSRNVFPLPLPDDTVMTFMTIFGVMAIGLNIVAGFAGLLDLGYVAFYAIGAYTAAFLASSHFASVSIVLFASVADGFPGIHLPFWVIVPAALLIAGTFGALLGAPTLRLRGDYLAIVTLGFGEIVPVFFRNMADVTFDFSLGPISIVAEHIDVTGGPLGINPIDAPFLPGLGTVFNASAGFAPVYLGIFLLVFAILIARNLERSRIGRAWMAIREDELAAEMMGVNTVRTKLLAFALGASFAGVAGSYQASYLGATTSDFFQFSTSILVLIMVILGGIGNIWGVLLGAFAVVYVDKTFLPYLGQQFQTIAPSFPNPSQFNFLFFGLALVVMMRFRPEGFLPNRQRAAELSAHGLAAASIARGEPVALDNTELAPAGQDEVSEDARAAETIAEARDE
jgi:branched-chain amino acid transport system permease protein